LRKNGNLVTYPYGREIVAATHVPPYTIDRARGPESHRRAAADTAAELG